MVRNRMASLRASRQLDLSLPPSLPPSLLPSLPASAKARRVASAENSSTHCSIIRKLPLDLDI